MLSFILAAEPSGTDITKLEKLVQKFWDWGVEAGSHLLAAALIFIIGRILISFLNKLVARILARRKVDPSV